MEVSLKCSNCKKPIPAYMLKECHLPETKELTIHCVECYIQGELVELKQ